MRLEINPRHPEPRKIARAVEALRRGGVIAYPTDTVYGLGCDVFQKKAVDRLYQIKRMKTDQPLAFVVPDLSDIAKYAIVEDWAYRVMRRLIPGPYCFVLQATKHAPKNLVMRYKTVGIRVPQSPVALALVKELGNPIVSTSAEIEGEVLNDPAEIDDRFAGLELVLDAGYGHLDHSTVLNMTAGHPEVIRMGAGIVDGVV